MAHLTAVDDAAWASPWRERAVGSKVALSLALVLTALLTPAWPGCLLVAIAAVALMLGPARIRPGLVAVVTVPPVVFIAVGVLPIALQVGGTPWLAWADDGGARALSVLAHGVAGTLALLLLATTTPMIDLLTWTRQFGIPGPLLEIAELMYRLVFVLLSTAVAVQAAQRARLGGCAPLRRRLAMAADAFATVLLRSWNQAVRLQRGLELRGYEEELPTLRHQGRWTPGWIVADLAIIAGVWAACWLAA